MKKSMMILSLLSVMASCDKPKTPHAEKEFQYLTEQFADLKTVRYQIPGFDQLTPKQKELIYYLYQAALSGRDMFWDQNYANNLAVRRTLEAVVNSYKGDRTTEAFRNFLLYTKRVWFSNGIHHHYSNYKFEPGFSKETFADLVKQSPEGRFPLRSGESIDQLIARLTPVLFDPAIAPLKVNLDPKVDLIVSSANNNYEGVTQKEVENYYAKLVDKKDPEPVWHGLNSKLVKVNGVIQERTWKVGGMYSPAIEKVVYWLEKAVIVAENDLQKRTWQALIDYYKTGDLKKWNEYNILWVSDTESRVDAVNGFVEVYGDPLGLRGQYEAIVSFKDQEASKRIAAIGNEAQWFEDHSTIDDKHKKKNVKGISAKVITVVVEAGDASPTTPIGINLPNANWIRQRHGSKSVNLGNIVDAYNEVQLKSGAAEEFYYSTEIVDRLKTYGALSDNLHTDMHEVIGHASGQINEGIGTPKETLKSYASTIEEARADLVALYFIMDQKLIDIGVMPNFDAAKAEYDRQVSNGLMIQMTRLKLGEDIQESHMRNRQLIATWVYEKGKTDKVIEKKTRDGRTFFVINDYLKLRELFGQLLKETQRITSEGDFAGARDLVETYGVRVDQDLHKEILERYKKLSISPYVGFINPRLVPVMEGDKMVDVKVEYPEDFAGQMLEYAREYSFLPNEN